MTVGIIEGLSSVIGESDSEIGGVNITRLVSEHPVPTAFAASLTWDGTTTVLASDTSEAGVGDLIRLDVHAWFSIASVDPGVSYEIANPTGTGIPTGTEQSYFSGPFTDVTTLLVETTLGWSDEGSFAIGGVKYRYTGKTLSPASFTGVTHRQAGAEVNGIKFKHPEGAGVLDLTRGTSGLDLVRRAMLVEYAEGEDLNALGRNMGVNRLPFLKSDDQFREIVKALAYNPKGTLYGLILALDALVGAGNYEVYEDLINFPCTVFITLKGGASTDDSPFGKTYLQGPEYQLAASLDTVLLTNDVADRGSVRSVKYAPTNDWWDFRETFPSDFKTDHDSRVPWVYSGTEGVNSVLDPVMHALLLTGPPAFPGHDYTYQYPRILDDGDGGFEVTLNWRPGLPGPGTTPSSGFHVIVNGRRIGVGASYNGPPPPGGYGVEYSFVNWTVPSIIGTVSQSYVFTNPLDPTEDPPDVKLVREHLSSTVELYVDGVLVDSQAITAFPVDASPREIVFGWFAGSGAPYFRFFGFKAEPQQNFWNMKRADGTTSSPGTGIFTSLGGDFQVTDEGKQVRVTGNTSNQNLGNYFIETFTNPGLVTLEGYEFPNAQVETANPTRITIPLNAPKFTYPNDIGKKVRLSGSGAGNDGEWVIGALLQEGTLIDLSTFDTPGFEEKTNVCEVVGAAFNTEAGLNYQLNPAFTSDGSVDFELTDAGQNIGNSLQLRDDLPITDPGFLQYLEIVYTQVLTGQVLLDNNVVNQVIQSDPDLLFAYYPFYIADPLGFVRTYADAVTAAGVIPDFKVE